MDEEAGTGQYFQTRGYKSRYPDFKAIDKGVRALGGHLEVRWDDAKGGHVPVDVCADLQSHCRHLTDRVSRVRTH